VLLKKIIINGKLRNKHVLIVIYHSSLLKAAMNAVRVCKTEDGGQADFSKNLSRLSL
jgi:hypothetical protein